MDARLRELRVAAGRSEQVLADLINVTCQQVQKYEGVANRATAGIRDPRHRDALRLLTRIFGRLRRHAQPFRRRG